ncbi:Barwin-related endoglucanase [Botryosphaeria dothidea]|uniref:Barwin-related endoglucanase n=1 Tax=Botryosphaeria dothidea TaxID=55169 RepID=A0A8H4NCA5_9PEZI|nr:Barwin-related endoglucanase [Botryosphaeria dothidea]
MKTTGIIALSLLGLAAAAPHKHHQLHKAKRDLVWVTETAEVIETVVQTTTVWVDPEDYPEPTTTEEAPEHTPAPEPTTTEEAPATTEVPSSSSVYTPPPAPTTTETPSSTYTPPPAPTTTEAPTSTYVAPPAPETTSSSTTSAVVAAETAASSSGSSSSLGGDLGAEKSGCEATWYNTLGAYAACGTQHWDSESVVALKSTTFNQYKSEICGKTITLNYKGKSTTAKLVDSCPGCIGTWDIDLSPPVFEALTGDLGVGRIDGLTWTFD